MNPLSLAYLAATHARNLLYDTGLFSGRLPGPVVSVGSLSAGGAGKTPFVIALGELLKARGVKFDVLSRGYGRTSKGVLLVEPGGTAEQFGDEPLLIARTLGVPVVVGEDRYHAGIYAEQLFGPELHLLDDGFQHRALHRDLDIVLLTAPDIEDSLLPIGRLREPLSSLHRAHGVVIMDDLDTSSLHLEVPVWRARRSLILPAELPSRPIAFCGIARPANFFSGLRHAEVDIVAEESFRDHHRYIDTDISKLLALKAEKNAGGFLTTEKDVINLGPLAQRLSPLGIVRLTTKIENPAALLQKLLALR